MRTGRVCVTGSWVSGGPQRWWRICGAPNLGHWRCISLNTWPGSLLWECPCLADRYVIHCLTRPSLSRAWGIIFLKARKDSCWVNPGTHAGAGHPASSWVTAPSHCPQIPCWALLSYCSENEVLILPAAAKHRFPMRMMLHFTVLNFMPQFRLNKFQQLSGIKITLQRHLFLGVVDGPVYQAIICKEPDCSVGSSTEGNFDI